jgi:hypothetical protein
MGILSTLMGKAESTARTGRSAGRTTGRPATGRRGTKVATSRRGGMSGGTGRGMRRGAVTPPAASGGLGKLIGSLTRRR